ncbi:acyltransferase [Rhodopirellula sp. JC740]|uniref:Acyltransferase n=1 Tax=Rhodopirellula halodulae TaxID=2894198 RepID=A0ABS8NJW5_9BACT|nr:acyltransferase [Rhodopirellula sp. JC740]MCC9643844.1 acyltransferase [Rhodopirellula sp. JC740]
MQAVTSTTHSSSADPFAPSAWQKESAISISTDSDSPAATGHSPAEVRELAKAVRKGQCIESVSSDESAAALKPHRRIVELDALRAMAAINLVLFHFTHVYAVKFGYTSPLGGEWPYGAYGVELFFILSGFVNSMSLLRRGKPTDFVAARLIRIVPLFLMVIGANLWITTLAPLNGQPVSTAQFLANLTLMPRVFGYECIDPVMWTLQVEMMFYFVLVTLFCKGFLKRYFVGWVSLLAASLVLCPTLDAAKASYGDTTIFAAFTAVRHLLVLDFAPLFAIGFLLYMIKTGVGPKWKNLLGIVIAAGVFHSIDHGKHNPAATVLIIGLVTMAAYGKIPVLRLKPFVTVSAISYALYLCHNNLGCALIHAFDHAGVPPLASLAIAIVFSFALALVITNRVEQPITKALRRLYAKATERARQPAAEPAV